MKTLFWIAASLVTGAYFITLMIDGGAYIVQHQWQSVDFWALFLWFLKFFTAFVVFVASIVQALKVS